MQVLKLQIGQANALLAAGRAGDALAVTEPLARSMASVDALGVHAQVLKALGRPEEALDWDRKATARFPENYVAWHNLAATLGDLGHGDESRQAAERAFALGLDAPQTWLVYARALATLGEAGRAEDAFRQVLKRAPATAPALLELAELLWTARADLAGALALMDEAQAAMEPATPFVLKAAGLLRAAGQPDAADERLAAWLETQPSDVGVALALSDALLKRGQAQEALGVLRVAVSRHPTHPVVLSQVSWTQSALGRGAEALVSARAGLNASPAAQALLSAEAVAARLVGDPAYGRLYDYAALVRGFEIPTPPGWANLPAYLADLAAAIGRLHRNQAHPSDQSLQGGSQTTFRLTGNPDPVIQAFFKAIDGPIRAYMAGLGPGGDPLRRRNTGDYRIAGAWSVRLRAGDFHRDHLHSEGWLSSAFYVETPDVALAREGQEGWLRFGQPPFPTQPALPAEHFERPAPGKLVLFPSYMWHGTQPFTGDERRTTIAFDVLPA